MDNRSARYVDNRSSFLGESNQMMFDESKAEDEDIELTSSLRNLLTSKSFDLHLQKTS